MKSLIRQEKSHLFGYLKLAAFNNFPSGVSQLEDIYAPKEIRHIYDVFLVTQIEFIYLFSKKIKELDGVIFIVFLGNIFESDDRKWLDLDKTSLSPFVPLSGKPESRLWAFTPAAEKTTIRITM